jgi:tritrans,polycis-undecaprenyl-diphosphate synthase [geranylgeranyl-diphosphate specific]
MKAPNHIVFIPDGNRRWARLHRKPALEGHRVGIDKLRDVIEWCREAGVKTVTFWGFSLENFQREREEVNGLMRLFEMKFDELKDRSELHKNRIRVRFFGRLDLLPKGLREKLMEVEKETADYRDYNLNILLAYGGRRELVDACNAAIADAKAGRIDHVDEESFGGYMYMKDVPEPDLIIRTSGEQRLSGILPWHSGYSELFFSRKLWPDFGRSDFRAALREYARRKRRFGR